MDGIYEEDYISICLEYANRLLQQSMPVIFDLEHIKKILKLNECDMYAYHKFKIYAGVKEREISSPSRKIKSRQRWILDNILGNITIHESAHGFVKGKSIVTNAREHIGQYEMLNIDIKNFFDSINSNEVARVFRNIGYTEEVINKLTEICTFDNVLPKGAPTSPCLSNIICLPIDVQLKELADTYNLKYTRYADDMTFSGERIINTVRESINNIINKQGFELNTNKTRYVKGNKRKMVTGIVVGDKLRVPKRFKRKLKQDIYYCQRFGAGKHLENINATRYINFRSYMYGRAYFVKMVEEKVGEKYLNELDLINWN